MPAKLPAGMLRCGRQHPHSSEHRQQLSLCSSSISQGWEGCTSGQAWLPKSMGCALLSPCGWEFGCPQHCPVMLWQGELCPQLHCCLGELGRSHTDTYIKLYTIGAVTNSWAQGEQFGRRWASLDLRRDQLPPKRVCLGFHISLNHPLKKFTTTLSDLYKRHKQDNPSIIRVAKLCWAARKQQPHAARSRDLPQIQEAAQALGLLMGKWGRTRSPISSQHTSLCSTPHISDTQHC